MQTDTEIEFHPRFRRYTSAATHRLGRIAAALARIEASDIRPAAEDELRVSAKVGTVHYSTLIEGNELPIVEAERAARGDLEADTRAKIELINYVDALDFLDARIEADDLMVTPAFLLELHRVATRGLGAEDSAHFKPHHEGDWRDGVALVADRIAGKVFHEGPPAKEVEPRVRGLCSWISQAESRIEEFPPPVVAGVAHYAVTDIHPFADGNGRIARLLSAGLLMRHKILPGWIFSFERFYADNRDAYYDALRSVMRRSGKMECWLEYFLEGLAKEYERVADKVSEFGRLGLRSSRPFQLSFTQERAIAQLNLAGIDEFRRTDYERISGVGKRRANRDLASLREAELIVQRGSGPAARYRFRSAGWEERRGRKRSWTDERIEEELRDFCQGRNSWPSVAEFRNADRMPLYAAVSRYGGAEHWAAQLRLTR